MADDLTTFQGLITGLRQIFNSDEINVEEVQKLLASYKSRPADWRKYAMFDVHRYTRNLVDEGNGKYNLMLLCWGEGMGSSIHDHTDSHCFVKMLDGTLRETLYDWPTGQNEPLRVKSAADVVTDDVCYINDSMGLHRMENPSHTDSAVSLHVYIPPFQHCQTFDQHTGNRYKCKVTFWSKYGERTRPSIDVTNEIPPEKRDSVVSLV